MASDALLSEWADSFLDRLTPENRALWEELEDDFIREPRNESTIWYPEAGDGEAQATLVGPFFVVWKYLNAEVIAVGTIRWGPDAPASDPNLQLRL